MSALEVRRWTDAEFAAGREPWNALLARSGADPLFLRWDWCEAWWRHHGPLLEAELCVYAIHDGTELVGLAPLYRRRATVRWPLRARRLELLGNAWRDPRPFYSEYLDVLAAPAHRAAVVGALVARLLGERDWDELAFAATCDDSVAADLARELAAAGAVARATDPLDSHRIRLPAAYASYLESLSSDARRRLHHQRQKLPLAFEVATSSQVEAWLGDLHRLRAGRWGAAGGGEALRAFQCEYAARAAGEGRLRLTRLALDGRPVSVMLDVRAGDTEYYLQSGFDPAAAPGVSPGYLHFGHAIEQACHDGLAWFDLLGGAGRHRDYKQDLRAERRPMHCRHVVRAPWLRGLHAFRAMLGRTAA